jgi:8-hydroxy-5-deazaflavin:NADPH oxidoreductase
MIDGFGACDEHAKAFRKTYKRGNCERECSTNFLIFVSDLGVRHFVLKVLRVQNRIVMRIGIIGTGNIGKTLIRKLTRAGHTIQMANSRGPETLRELAEETGAKALTAKEAIQGVDVIILSIPLNKLPDMKELLAGSPNEVIIADTSNYYPMRDGNIEALDNGQVESEWVSEQIGRPVIKAWNNVLAGTFADKGLPAGTRGRIALSVAGDDPNSKKIVMSLIDDTGFDAIDAGLLSESWRQQPGTPAYCADQTKTELQSALVAADRTRAPKVRDEIMKEVIALGDKLTNEDILRLNRSFSV